MTARSFVVLLTLSLFWIVSVNAGDREPVQAAVPAGTIAEARVRDELASNENRALGIEPWIHPGVPVSTKAKLETGFELAVERVRQVPECGGLFDELGADPVDTLSNAMYFAANPYKETTLCRGAAAFTYVGERPTRLCRRFDTLSDEWAATVVIHEALHGAGLTEKPYDPKAKSSGAINKMVRTACGL